MICMLPPLAETFVRYGLSHWVVIGTMIVATVVLSRLLRRTTGQAHEQVTRRTVCWSLALILLGGATVAQVQRIVGHTWTAQESLPLHLCDIGVFVTAGALVGAGWGRSRRDGDSSSAVPVFAQRLYECAYTWALGGTSQSVLTPDLADPFPGAEFLRYFLLHGGIVVSVFVLTFGLRMRPQRGAVWRVWLVTLALGDAVMVLDWMLGANYMYLLGPPKHPTMIDLFGPWPWSLLTLAVVGTLLIMLVHAPFWIIDRRAARHSELSHT